MIAPPPSDVARELAVIVQRLNDLHLQLQVQQRLIDQQGREVARMSRELERRRARRRPASAQQRPEAEAHTSEPH